MITYEELYDYLRKEKSSETLQNLPADFLSQFSDFLCDHKRKVSRSQDLFSEDALRGKKEYENSMTLFKELMLRRKKKILDLVFVAAETGVRKRDFSEMLTFEQELFQSFLEVTENVEQSVQDHLNNCSLEDAALTVKLLEDVEKFVSMTGDVVGPFKKDQTVVLDGRVADVLISGQKAEIVK